MQQGFTAKHLQVLLNDVKIKPDFVDDSHGGGSIMGKIILAIDDDEVFLKTLKDMMEEEGYEVKTLADPTRTEEYIEKYRPALLIVDIFMPVKSGFNLLEDFNDEGKYGDLPKIFLTALDDEVEKMTARACGVKHYITKPFNPQDLLNIVEDVVGKGRE